MNEGDRRRLREAAAEVEAAESRVTGLIGLASEDISSEDRMAPEEMAALHEISSNLKAASIRMWSMADEERA
jgi:hypothetical protein